MVKLFNTSSNFQLRVLKSSPSSNLDSLKYENKHHQDRDYLNYQPVLVNADVDLDSYKIEILSNISKIETFYLKSLVPKLQNYLQFLLQNKNVDIKTHLNLAKELKQILLNLTDFCLNKIYYSSPENQFGEPNSFRQKYMRELYIVDLLVDIVKQEVP